MHVNPPGFAYGIELIDEYDTRGILHGLHKEISYPRRPDSDKHFDKVRTGQTEEGNACLARDCASEQGFSGTRRPHDQNTFGNTPAQALIRIWIFHKPDNFSDFLFGLVDSRDIGECDSRRLFNIDLRLAFTDLH